MKKIITIKIVASVAIALVAMLQTGCKEDEGEKVLVPAQGIIAPEDVYMCLGETTRIEFSVVPENADLSELEFSLEFPHLAELTPHDGVLEVHGLMDGETKLYIDCGEDAFHIVMLHIIDPDDRLWFWTSGDEGERKYLEEGQNYVYGWFGKTDGYASIYMKLSGDEVIDIDNLSMKYSDPLDLVYKVSDDGTQVTFLLRNTLNFGKSTFEFKYQDALVGRTFARSFSVTSSPGPGIDSDFSLTYRVGGVNETVRADDTIYLTGGVSGAMYAKGSIALNWTSGDAEMLTVTPAKGKGDKYWATAVEFKAGSKSGSTTLALRDQQGKTITLPVVIN